MLSRPADWYAGAPASRRRCAAARGIFAAKALQTELFIATRPPSRVTRFGFVVHPECRPGGSGAYFGATRVRKIKD